MVDKAEMEAEFGVYTKKLQSIFSYVQSVYDLATKSVNGDIQGDAFLRKVFSIEGMRLEYSQMADKVARLEVLLKPATKVSFTSCETINDMVSYIMYVCEELKSKKQAASQASTSTVNVQQATLGQQPTHVRLQALELPSFGGNIGEWPMFHEVFKANIHERGDLPKVHKLQYLLSKLTGRALSVCAGIPPSEENYDVIWRNLVDKYEDQRNLATHYMDTLYSFKPLRMEGSAQLGAYVDKIGATVAALKALHLDNLGEFVLFYLAQLKLDDNTKRLFELSLQSKEIPTFEKLLTFVQNQAKVLSRLHISSSNSGSHGKSGLTEHSKAHSFHVNEKQSFHVNEKAMVNCVFCGNNHNLTKCNGFLKISPQDRYRVVKDNSLCVKCLNSQHKATDCPIQSDCTICGLKHNTLLHFPQFKVNKFNNGGGKPKHSHFPSKMTPSNSGSSNKQFETSAEVHSPADKVFSSMCAEPKVSNICENVVGTTVLLSTVKALVFDADGRPHELRFLLDSGSMTNLLTTETCEQLNLEMHQSHTLLSGIGSTANPVQGQVMFKMSSVHDNRINFTIKALVVDNIVEKLPISHVDCSGLHYLEDIVLADNEFMKPGNISGILGASICSHLFDGKSIRGKEGQPTALSTKLGYVIMGTVPVLHLGKTESEQFCMFQKTELDFKLERFWELDQVPDSTFSKLTKPEQQCEQHYLNNVKRDSSGRYMVSLPFCEDTCQLGDSYVMAKKRFSYLEKKLVSNTQIGSEYSKAMSDLLDKGYMVESKDQNDHTGYFIPHHMVVKPDSVSTKLRVVFDASAKTTSGKSLNDILYTGDKLYSDLFGILVNFRLFPCALNGDITKMFLQILVQEEDCKFQKVIWRFNPSDPLTLYEMKVVIFGMRSSPFLAQRTVQQLVNDEVKNYPGASKVLEYLYMDDCVASFPTINETKSFYHDVVNLFKSGGFTFTKWISNTEDIMSVIPDHEQLTKLISFDSKNGNVKILGMLWNAEEDFLYFKFVQFTKPCTKRGILSAVLTIYDPMGLLAPIVFWVKLLIRELCTLKMDWDSTPPPKLISAWQSFCDQLPQLESLKFPRHIGVVVDCNFQLVGFCDASEQGYGTIIYSRVKLPNGNIRVELICAKSKVAPLKTQSIPRLELCAILLLSNLMKSVMNSYSARYKIDSYFGFTDSTVALCWVHGSPHLWNVFVANRVSEIQQNLDCNNIYHTSGTDNPADCLSRGEMPAQFVGNNLYFHGPQWLQEEISQWPVTSYSDLKCSEIPERKPASVLLVVNKPTFVNPLKDLFLNASSWPKLVNTVVYILKFMKKLSLGSISVHDLEVAENFIVMLVQRESFASDIDAIENKLECGKTLRKLSPFLEEKVLKVGGRLSNANLSKDQQHPMLLPAHHHVTELIVTHCHLANFHTGPFLLLAVLRQKYWIVGGRNLARKIVQKCNICFKLNPRFNYPKMGDLPAARVTGLKAFYNSACDFLGPINIVMERKRGSRSVKAYICLFICLATKALHLEVVANLSTPAFLNAFKRFVSRRGPIKSMLSDNGTNFVGAKNHLDDIYALFESKEFKQAFGQEMLENRIEWKFNPPASPHFGGIFEGNVKSFKTHFLKVIGTQLLTYEEFLTITVQIEGILNSRPLCVLSSDPADCRPLTPNHFLNFTDLKHIPARDVVDENPGRLTRFQLLDQMIQSFWKRWSNEYLTELQVREKWSSTIKNLEPGIVVIVKQENSSPLMWPVGVITEVFPGKDGIVRVASVRTPRGDYKRPVCKLAPLPTQ